MNKILTEEYVNENWLDLPVKEYTNYMWGLDPYIDEDNDDRYAVGNKYSPLLRCDDTDCMRCVEMTLIGSNDIVNLVIIKTLGSYFSVDMGDTKQIAEFFTDKSNYEFIKTEINHMLDNPCDEITHGNEWYRAFHNRHIHAMHMFGMDEFSKQILTNPESFEEVRN